MMELRTHQSQWIFTSQRHEHLEHVIRLCSYRLNSEDPCLLGEAGNVDDHHRLLLCSYSRHELRQGCRTVASVAGGLSFAVQLAGD
jgi:hypothetical protein